LLEEIVDLQLHTAPLETVRFKSAKSQNVSNKNNELQAPLRNNNQNYDSMEHSPR